MHVIEDYESSDNYVIADPLLLFNVAVRRLDDLTVRCVPAGNDKNDLIAAIVDFVGCDGCFPLEHGFSRPKVLQGELTEVTGDSIVLKIPGGASYVPFSALDTKELKKVIQTINEYLDYCRKEA